MGDSFDWVRFGDLLEVPLRNGLYRPKKIRGEGVKMVNMGELFTFNRISNQEMERVPLSKKEEPDYLLESGDLLFARQSLVREGAGKCSIFLGSDEPTTFEGHLIRARLDSNKADPNFYYYLFSSHVGRSVMNTIIEQVAAAGIRQTDLAVLEVPYLPLDQQQEISTILSVMDEKIELNLHANATLGAIARAIFKSWFVDFDPVHAKLDGRHTRLPSEIGDFFPDGFDYSESGKIPAGWRISSIGNHINVTKGLSYKGKYLSEDCGLPMHNLNSIYEGGGYKYEGIKYYTGDFKDRHKVNPGDIIVANTEQGFDHLLIGYPAIIPTYFGEEGIYSHHIYRLQIKKGSPLTNYFLYFLLMSYKFRGALIGYTNGSTVNMLDADGLKRPRFLLPPEQLIRYFHKMIEPILKLKEANYSENETLSQIRDGLLPRLLRGDLGLV
jgi:type I restriction enzyme S subunit